jgi:hypothetical protein
MINSVNEALNFDLIQQILFENAKCSFCQKSKLTQLASHIADKTFAAPKCRRDANE